MERADSDLITVIPDILLMGNKGNALLPGDILLPDKARLVQLVQNALHVYRVLCQRWMAVCLPDLPSASV